MQITTPLDEVISTLRRKYGQKVIHLASQTRDSLPLIPTSIKELDTMLNGGIPYRHLTEFAGKPTSGTMTCMYQTIASLQSQSYEVVYLDMPQTFDAMTAVAYGVTLENILIVHPPNITHASELMRDIALSGVPCLMILDLFGIRVSTRLNRQHLRLAQSNSLGLLLSPYRSGHADVCVYFQQLDWIRENGDITGYQVKASVLHHPRLTHKRTQLAIPLMAVNRD